MKKTFMKTIATLLAIVTVLCSLSLCGAALEPIEAEQETISAMMDNSYCFKKPASDGTETDADVTFGTSTDADDTDIPSTDGEKVGFFARIWRCIRNFFSFKWLF